MAEQSDASICANCGVRKMGEFCAGCGQNSRNYLQALHRLVAEVLGEVFELDSRLLVTVRALLFSPGHLSSEFSKGRRASYVPPVRLYLVVSLVFFFLLTLTAGVELKGIEGVDIVSGDMDATVEQLDGEMSEAEIRELRDAFSDQGERESELGQAIMANVRKLLEDPSSAFADFLENLPATMFVLLPLFALLLKLFYRQRFYAEHFVFALHLHSFYFVIFTLLLFLPDAPVSIAVGDGVSGEALSRAVAANTAEVQATGGFSRVWESVESLLLFSCLVYTLVAMKRFYGQSLLATCVKTFSVYLFYWVLVLIVLVGALLFLIIPH